MKHRQVARQLASAELVAIRIAYERLWLLFWGLRQTAITVVIVAFTVSIVVRLIAGYPPASDSMFERLLWFLTG